MLMPSSLIRLNLMLLPIADATTKPIPKPLAKKVAARFATFGVINGLQLYSSLLRSLNDPCPGSQCPLSKNDWKTGELCKRDTGGWWRKEFRAGDGDDRLKPELDGHQVARIRLAVRLIEL